MSSADPATVVIACPSCGTRYQVPYGTLGPDGREVSCAQCGKPWHATADAPLPAPLEAAAADSDALFSSADEAALDAAFEAEARGTTGPAASDPGSIEAKKAKTLEEIRAAIAPKRRPAPSNTIDPALLRRSRRAFDARQARLTRRLPVARMRRTARLAAFVALASVLMLGFSLRTDLVRWFPSLAGLYAAMGVPVNVVGLEFSDPRTLTTLRDGKAVMTISGRIRSVSSHTVEVPPVLVSLLDANGATIYEWTVAPRAPRMDPGEVLDFSTEVTSPPAGAAKVRLAFTTSRGAAAPAVPTKAR